MPRKKLLKLSRQAIRRTEQILEIYRHANRLLEHDRDLILSTLPRPHALEQPIQVTPTSSPVESVVLLLAKRRVTGVDEEIDEATRQVVAVVEEAMRDMDARERRFLWYRWGAPRRHSMEEICAELGISRTTYKYLRHLILCKVAGHAGLLGGEDEADEGGP